MRYTKAALVGLLAGVLLASIVLGVEMMVAQRTVSRQMADCHSTALSDRTDFVCDSTMQVGGMELVFAFAVGFASEFVWSLRRQRHPVA